MHTSVTAGRSLRHVPAGYSFRASKSIGVGETTSAPIRASAMDANAWSRSAERRTSKSCRPTPSARPAASACSRMLRVGRLREPASIPKNRDLAGARDHLLEQFQALRDQLGRKGSHASNVSTGARQAGDRACAHRVRDERDDDGDPGSRLFRREGGRRRRRNDDVHVAANQVGGESRQPVLLARRPAVLNGKVLPLDPAQLAQPAEHVRAGDRAGGQREQANASRSCRLLSFGANAREQRRRRSRSARREPHPSCNRFYASGQGATPDQRLRASTSIGTILASGEPRARVFAMACVASSPWISMTARCGGFSPRSTIARERAPNSSAWSSVLCNRRTSKPARAGRAALPPA